MTIYVAPVESFDRSTPSGATSRPRRVEVHYLTATIPNPRATLAFRVTETQDARVHAAGRVAEWDQIVARVEVWRSNGWTLVETFRCSDDGIESTDHAVRVAARLIGRV